MKKIFALLLAAILVTGAFKSAYAVPASPSVKNIKMPDGSVIQAKLIGDERYSRFETLDGYTIIKNPYGYFEYAALDGNKKLVPSGTAVGEFPLPAQKHISPPREVIASSMKSGRLMPAQKAYASQITGTEKVVVLLIEFTDTTHSTSHGTSYFNTLYYGNSQGNLNHYLKAASYNQLDITGTVSSWLKSSKTMGYYGYETGNEMYYIQDLVEEAVAAADASINYDDYDQDGDGYVDHLVIVHAGGDYADTANPDEIWSHSWQIPDYTTNDGTKVSAYVMNSEDTLLGVHAHEFMHDIGAPDLYDYDYDGNPVSWWCIMDNGAYGGTPYGAVPTDVCGYLKNDIDAEPTNGYSGWLSAVTVTQSGDYSVKQLADSSGSRLYRVDVQIQNENEYFLLENRQLTGYDASLPESGIVVYHVDEDMPDGYGSYTINDGTPYNSYYRIAVEDPGNTFMKTDAAYSSDDMQTTFNKSSSPNSRSNQGKDSGVAVTNIGASSQTMSFSVTLTAGSTVSPPTVSVSASPTSGNAPLTVSFIGTATDTDGTIIAYHYDFGDGGVSNQKSPSHTFSSEGEYAVVFSATDNDGESATTTVNISVSKGGGGGGGGGGCGTINGFNIKPPTGGQIILDLLTMMIPIILIFGRRAYRFIRY